ncbi:unnamed protein product, partial [Meganyctiphanes norvegica]
QVESVEAMVSSGVDVSATDKDGHTAIDLAWMMGKHKVVDWLQTNTNCRSLLKDLTSAVVKGDQGEVVAALKAGVDASVVLPEYRGYCDMNLISIAAMEDQAEVIDILQRAGACIDHRNANGESALHIAAQCGSSQVLRNLLAHGLDVEAVSAYGWTSLHNAAHHGHSPCVKLLLEMNAFPDAQDWDQLTPLMLAAQQDQ